MNAMHIRLVCNWPKTLRDLNIVRLDWNCRPLSVYAVLCFGLVAGFHRWCPGDIPNVRPWILFRNASNRCENGCLLWCMFQEIQSFWTATDSRTKESHQCGISHPVSTIYVNSCINKKLYCFIVPLFGGQQQLLTQEEQLKHLMLTTGLSCTPHILSLLLHCEQFNMTSQVHIRCWNVKRKARLAYMSLWIEKESKTVNLDT